MRVYRQHKIKILGYTTKNFWLLAIPILRRFVASRFDVGLLLRTAWLDIFVLAVIFGIAFVRWYVVNLCVYEDKLVLESGVFVRKSKTVKLEKITSTFFYQNPLHRMFSAYKLFVNTHSSGLHGTNFDFVLTEKNFKEIEKILEGTKPKKAKLEYSPKILRLFFFLLVFSSSLSGVILFATFVIQMGEILGEEIGKRFETTFNEFTHLLSEYIPPAAATLAAVMILSWCLSFSINLIRYSKFNVKSTGEGIVVKSGVLTKRNSALNANRINFVDLKQNLVMKVFGFFSTNVDCFGYGSKNREISVLIPTTTEDDVKNTLRSILPRFTFSKISLKTNLRSLWAFVWLPVILSAVIPIAVMFKLIVNYEVFILEIPVIWLLTVRIAATFTTGLGQDKNNLTLSFCKLYKFHTVVIPLENVAKVKVYQTPFQRIRGKNCSICVYTVGSKTKRHKVKNLNYVKTLDFLEDMCYINRVTETEAGKVSSIKGFCLF